MPPMFRACYGGAPGEGATIKALVTTGAAAQAPAQALVPVPAQVLVPVPAKAILVA